MKRNLLLICAVVISLILASNSFGKIMSLRTTSNEVQDQEKRLEQLKQENDALRREYEYKKSEKFAEGEIRDKLGLAKEGEQVFVLPNKQTVEVDTVSKKVIPNWKKWRNLLLNKV